MIQYRVKKKKKLRKLHQQINNINAKLFEIGETYSKSKLGHINFTDTSKSVNIRISQ
jgi:hypothetical protein